MSNVQSEVVGGGSFFTSKINAAPFVPGSGNGKASQKSSLSQKPVKTQPSAPVGDASHGTSIANNIRTAVNAAPFVPKTSATQLESRQNHKRPEKASSNDAGTAAAAATTGTAAPASTPDVTSYQPQGHHGRNTGPSTRPPPSPNLPPPPRASPPPVMSAPGRGHSPLPPSGASRHGGRSVGRVEPGRGRMRPGYSNGGMGPGGAVSGGEHSYGGVNVKGVLGEMPPMALSAARGSPAMMHTSHTVAPGRAHMQVLFSSEQLRQQLQQMSFAVQAQWVPAEGADDVLNLPDHLGPYHSLWPLDEQSRLCVDDVPSTVLGVRSLLLKGISSEDGRAYALRRVDGKQVIPTVDLLLQARSAVDSWKPLSSHPSLVPLRAAFISSDLDLSPSLVFVHDFLPLARSLAQAHLMPRQSSGGLVAPSPPNEDVLWSYLVQGASALRAVHLAGKALRHAGLHPSKVLLTCAGRLKFGCVSGVVETLSGDVAESRPAHIAALQLEDLAALGSLILALACAGAPSPSGELMSGRFTPELCAVCAGLCSAGEHQMSPLPRITSWQSLMMMLNDRVMHEMDCVASSSETLMTELSKEYDNGRIARLLIRLAFISDRPPDHDLGPRWSEIGDGYLVQLFRDYVFHHVDEHGAVTMEWGHVIEALNKLDAGVPEKVLLLSRDTQSMLVASYADIKRCVEKMYVELKNAEQLARQRHRS